jgi:transcriptional regulator with XRE-family HTH domain
MAKLNQADVLRIKLLLLEGKSTQLELATEFGVSRSLISDIATERAYSDIGPSMNVVKNRAKGKNSFSPEERNTYLEGEVKKLREQLSINRKQLQTTSRQIYTADNFINELSGQIKPLKSYKLRPYQAKTKRTVNESAALMLSDIHADSVVDPNEVDGMEEYNFPIAVYRANHLVSEVIKFTQRSLSNFAFDELVVLGLGDYTSGEIHEYTSYFPDQFTADLAIGELIGSMLVDLAGSFRRVRFHNITGNHGRTTKDIEFDKNAVNHNHDTLIARIAELYCKGTPNIQFHFPESLSSIVDIKGSTFHLSHGHGKRQPSAVWSRAENLSQKVNSLHGGQIDYFCSGHYHTPGDVKVSGGATLLANGAFLACDQYSYQSLGESGTPSQTLFGIHAKNKVTWRLPINLNSSTNENRYTSLERFFK